MRLPSLRELLHASGRTFLRFPAVILNSLLGTVVALVLIEHGGPPQPTVLYKILFAALLGMPLFTALTLISETKKWGRTVFSGVLAAAAVLLAVYALTVPRDLPAGPEYHLARLLLLAVGLHLFAAVAPFAGKGGLNAFWHFNISVCVKAVTAFLFSMVLYAGLSIAVAALDNLFGIYVPEKRYFELWVFIVGIVTTWIFLAGVPEDLEALDALTGFHRVLRTFVQFILFPILLVYLTILYAYMVKIVVEWSWPRGWVSGLILGYAAAGLLLMILVHPLRDRGEYSWIRTAWRWFFVSVIPMVVMLVLAMWRRVSEYGITEERYLGMILGFWLAGIVLYFLIGKNKNIRAIPASLCLLAVFSSFGPWGAFGVSETSQVGRLRLLLEKNSMFADGMVMAPRDTVPLADRSQISSIIRYLYSVHGYDRIRPWFSEDLDRAPDGGGKKMKNPRDVAALLGIEFAAGGVNVRMGTVTFIADPASVADIGRYDRMIGPRYIGGTEMTGSFPSAGAAYRVSPGLDTLTVTLSAGAGVEDSVTVGLMPLARKLLAEHGFGEHVEIPVEEMSLEAGDPGMVVKISLRRLRLRREESDVTILGYDVGILYSLRERP